MAAINNFLMKVNKDTTENTELALNLLKSLDDLKLLFVKNYAS